MKGAPGQHETAGVGGRHGEESIEPKARSSLDFEMKFYRTCSYPLKVS